MPLEQVDLLVEAPPQGGVDPLLELVGQAGEFVCNVLRVIGIHTGAHVGEAGDLPALEEVDLAVVLALQGGVDALVEVVRQPGQLPAMGFG